MERMGHGRFINRHANVLFRKGCLLASPPLTDRTYAYFAITGSGKTDPVKALLPLEPVNSWSEGDKHWLNGKTFKHMSCKYESGLDDRDPLDEHIEVLLDMLQPYKWQLLHLAKNYDLTIHCVGYYPASGHGLHLDKDVVARAAELGLCFDLDFYYTEDNGHDLDFHH
jgi:hypothetical protein